MSQRHAFDTGTLVRRALFILVLILLTAGNLFALFRGLNSPQAMDQAQIAREISRGNGFTTKVIRPVAYYQASEKANGPVRFTDFKDTYHSPLNPLLNAAVLRLIGANDSSAWQMGENEMVFPLDRVIATVCTLYFLMAIGVNYLLISRIFDHKIAGVCAILMLFCQTFWDFSLSGLPQMLMLLLFSCAIYFVYRAIEAQSEGRLPFVHALIAGIFFTLLALTHWMTVWLALGYIIYASIAFRPRGIIGVSILLMIIVAAVGPMIRATNITGSPFGTAFLTLYNGLANGTEDAVMRSHNLADSPLTIDGLPMKILRTTLLQTTEIIPLLAGIIIAPLFFIALLHPFKRASISNFRWVILLMWVCGAVGLAFYGITTQKLDPNQIHLLFAPIMSAYGVAFVSILWSRLEVVSRNSILKNAHLIIIVLVCALPLALVTPKGIINGIGQRSSGGFPQWPPYFPQALNLGLKSWVEEKQLIVSDQPWAVAWYADRTSIWLPPKKKGFEELEKNASNFQTPIAGILISPSSNGSGSISEISQTYQDFTSLVIDGRVFYSVQPADVNIFQIDPKIESITKRYPYRATLVGIDMVYYSDRLLKRSATPTRN